MNTITETSINQASDSQSGTIKVNVPKRNGTGTTSVRLFQGTTNKINPRVYEHLKKNPFSVDLPDQYVFNQRSGRIKRRNAFVNADNNQLKPQFAQNFTLIGNSMVPKVSGGNDGSQAFKNYIKTFSINNTKNQSRGFNGFNLFSNFIKEINEELETNEGLDIFFTSSNTYTRTINGQMVGETEDPLYNPVKQIRITRTSNLEDVIKQVIEKSKENVEAQEATRGSGLRFKRVDQLFMNTLRYVPLSGGTFRPTPNYLKAKKGIINVKNNHYDCSVCRRSGASECQCCFLWSVIAGIHAQDIGSTAKTELRKYRKYEADYDHSMLTFPVEVGSDSIKEFEAKNNLSIAIFGYDDEKEEVYQLRQPAATGRQVNLIHFDNHYATISNLKRLLFGQVTKHRGGCHVCRYCLSHFTTEQGLKEHTKQCLSREEEVPPVVVEMPEEGSVCKFRALNKQFECPFFIVSDFECYTKPVHDTSKKKTVQTQQHVPNSWFVYVVCSEPSIDVSHLHKSYFGEDAVDKFIEHLQYVERHIVGYRADASGNPVEVEDDDDLPSGQDQWQDFLKQYRAKHPEIKGREVMKNAAKEYKATKPEIQRKTKTKWVDGILQSKKSVDDIIMTQADREAFKASKVCPICDRKYTDGNKKVRDHCHLTGKFKQVCCNRCNINRHYKHFEIPCFFHNLRGYDSHLIIQRAAKFGGKVDCTAQNSQRVISFKHSRIRFLDSAQHMNGSLEELVGDLTSGGLAKFKHLFQYFRSKGTADETIEMLTRKGVYPYDYATDSSVMQETTLPPIEKFYSGLTETECDPKDYAYAQQVWKAFKCKTLYDYHMLYLYTDVLLLADVLSEYRRFGMEIYDLDPLLFWTAPSFSWNAALKKSKVELELLSDRSLHDLYDCEMKRGGVSYIAKKYARANNKHLSNYDPKKPSNYILYTDMNQLYASPLSDYLPVGGFKRWEKVNPHMTPAAFKRLMNKDRNTGYTVKVDLKVPKRRSEIKHLTEKQKDALRMPEDTHQYYNSYPMAVESMTVTDEMLSPTQHKYMDHARQQRLTGFKCGAEKKLVPTLMDKKGYVCDIRLLNFYLDHGYILERVHEIIQFRQEPFLKEYIDLNTELRKIASKEGNDFRKAFFKLLNNAVFGKTMESVMNRADFELVTDSKRLCRLQQQGKIKNAPHIYGEDVVGVDKHKSKVVLDRPIYVGMTILDLAKLVMYRYWYDYLIPKYGADKVELLFTDTDSFCYEVFTDDVYADMKEDMDSPDTSRHWFDFSGYPKQHPNYDTRNEKVLEKMKDETNGVPVVEFCGLRAKMYSCLLDEESPWFRAGKDKRSKMTAKGIKRYTIKRMDHEEYVDDLNNLRAVGDGSSAYTPHTVSFNTIKGKDHSIMTVRQTKAGLCAFDTKSWLRDDGISQYRFGHHLAV